MDQENSSRNCKRVSTTILLYILSEPTEGRSYALFTDNKFHDIGVGVADGKISDVRRYAVTHDEAGRGRFKTPSLRNLALTARYMHDGGLKI